MKFLIWTKKNSLLTSIVFGAIIFLIVFFVPIYAIKSSFLNLQTLQSQSSFIFNSSLFIQLTQNSVWDIKSQINLRQSLVVIPNSTYNFLKATYILYVVSIYLSLFISAICTLIAVTNHKKAYLWYEIHIACLLVINIVVCVFLSIPTTIFGGVYSNIHFPFVGFFILSAIFVLILIYRRKDSLSVPTSV